MAKVCPVCKTSYPDPFPACPKCQLAAGKPFAHAGEIDESEESPSDSQVNLGTPPTGRPMPSASGQIPMPSRLPMLAGAAPLLQRPYVPWVGGGVIGCLVTMMMIAFGILPIGASRGSSRGSASKGQEDLASLAAATRKEMGAVFLKAAKLTEQQKYSDAAAAMQKARDNYNKFLADKAQGQSDQAVDPAELFFQRSCDDMLAYWNVCEILAKEMRAPAGKPVDAVNELQALLLSIKEAKPAGAGKAIPGAADFPKVVQRLKTDKELVKGDPELKDVVKAVDQLLLLKQEAQKQLAALMPALKKLPGIDETLLQKDPAKAFDAVVSKQQENEHQNAELKKSWVKAEEERKLQQAVIDELKKQLDKSKTAVKTPDTTQGPIKKPDDPSKIPQQATARSGDESPGLEIFTVPEGTSGMLIKKLLIMYSTSPTLRIEAAGGDRIVVYGGAVKRGEIARYLQQFREK